MYIIQHIIGQIMINANKRNKVEKRSKKYWVVREGLLEKVAFV